MTADMQLLLLHCTASHIGSVLSITGPSSHVTSRQAVRKAVAWRQKAAAASRLVAAWQRGEAGLHIWSQAEYLLPCTCFGEACITKQEGS